MCLVSFVLVYDRPQRLLSPVSSVRFHQFVSKGTVVRLLKIAMHRITEIVQDPEQCGSRHPGPRQIGLSRKSPGRPNLYPGFYIHDQGCCVRPEKIKLGLVCERQSRFRETASVCDQVKAIASYQDQKLTKMRAVNSKCLFT
jgi:hypothetical protein